MMCFENILIWLQDQDNRSNSFDSITTHRMVPYTFYYDSPYNI